MSKLMALIVWLLLATSVAIPSLSLAAQEGDPVARGKYLVERVAMCADCHSPRGAGGQLDRAQWLHGTQLDFKPVNPMPNWAEYAPPLAGFGGRGSGWTEEQAIKLLETGLAPHGKPLRPPMPMYQMSREDAAAVIAYLKSLPRPRMK